MPIPDYQSLMLPLLRLMGDGKERRIGEVVNELVGQFNLSPGELAQTIASGNRVFDSRVGWARAYLKQAGVLEYPGRGTLRITQRGRQLLASNPAAIGNRDLRQYEEFREFTERKSAAAARAPGDGAAAAPVLAGEDAAESPVEQIESGYRRLRAEVEVEILNRTKEATPQFFERLVVRLLVAMGYGGSLAEAGEVVGRSGDGGIDGVIREDRLGLGVIAIQAKRWDHGTVGPKDVQAFVGALHTRGTKKGVFITTSTFTQGAVEYAKTLTDVKVVLVDAPKLAALMFDFGLGVTTESEFAVKRIDSDFFDEGV